MAVVAGGLSAGLAWADAGLPDRAPVKPAIPKSVPPSAKLPAGRLPQVASSGRASAAAAAGTVTPRFDVDKDGVSDVLVRTLDDSLYVKGWKDDKTALYTSDKTAFKDLIEPGDIDGDGAPELLTLSASGTLTLTPSKWGAKGWSEGGWNIYNKVFVPGDMNGDGRNDLMARGPSGELYLFLGTGNTELPYLPRTQVGRSWNAFDQLVGAGDLNGDGYGDIVARTPGGDLWLYAGTGQAASPLKQPVKMATGWGGYNQILAVDDSTGHVDLLARDIAGSLWLYPTDGKGGLGARVQLGTGWQGTTLGNAGGNPVFGKNELIGRDAAGTLSYYLPQGDGQFASPLPIDGDMSSIPLEKLSSASSLNNASRWSSMTMVRADGHLLVDGDDVGGGWNTMNAFAGIGDVNNDGNGDLLARDTGGRLYLYPGNGSHGFGNRTDLGGGWNAFTALIGAGDVTGDGLPDLLARDGSSGHLFLYPGNGRGGFGDRVDIGPGWNTFSMLAAPGDLNGDGRTDLIGVDSAGTAWRYDADGLGNFKARVTLGGGWNTFKALY
ncbi:VCBS repeat-containing protein [Streptomyces mauvecolor]|uniref:VCBS repeat-containing protein n=1 Tax=Streptomyces mauvecolor TaxID=58345 RepID=A0ABV9UK50_9ACTN